MKYSWFINLTTEKQTMATRGVWHPLLPNTEVSNTTVSATRSALQQEAAIRRRRRADIQVNVVIPTHNFCSLVFLKNPVFNWDKVERKCCWFSSLGPDQLLSLTLWRSVNNVSDATLFWIKKKKKTKKEKNILWKWNCGRETNHIIASVQCCSKTEEGGEREKWR